MTKQLAARLRASLVFLLMLALLPLAAAAAPRFPALSGRVVDNAGILSARTETDLTAKLASLEQQTHRQLVVVTLRDLQGYEIEDYGYQLGRAWGIGRAAEDDGVLFIVAPNDRAVRIEVGYGLEPILTDALSSVILNERVLPRFRDGDLEAGVVGGADALIEQLRLPADQAEARAVAAAEQAKPRVEIAPLIITLIVVFWIVMGMLRAFGGRRRRRGGLGDAAWLWPILYSASRDWGRGGGRGGWGGGGGWSGGGGFSGGGGSFGGGGASGRW